MFPKIKEYIKTNKKELSGNELYEYLVQKLLDTYQYSIEINIRDMCIAHSFNASKYLDKWQDILIGDFITTMSS